MARKPSTPPPPSPVQAPKARGNTNERSARTLIYGAAAAGVLILAVVLVVVLTSGTGSKSTAGDEQKVAAAFASAGCTFKTVPGYVPKGQPTHVDSLVKKLPWNTSPPSNGQHYPQWAVWGFYTDPINPRRVVHNEEHGGVVLWWGPTTSKDEIDALKSFYNDQPEGMFGTPYRSLGSKVAITAWTGDPAKYQRDRSYYGQGHIGVCPRFDAGARKAFAVFRDAYRGKGPEGIPLSADAPGMGPQ